jgi:hypothetical protein
MAATSITTPGEALSGIPIGPRLRAELERRVRELEGRFKPAPRDMRELVQLKEFLKVTPIRALCWHSGWLSFILPMVTRLCARDKIVVSHV